jgi:hypothetical protein
MDMTERMIGKIVEIIKSDGDDCSLCRSPFPSNSLVTGGIARGGGMVLVGDCCHQKLKERHVFGIYVADGDTNKHIAGSNVVFVTGGQWETKRGRIL